jgi:hypothetical protein
MGVKTKAKVVVKTKDELQKISAIAVPFGNDTHVVTPRAWNGKRIWCITQWEYDVLRQKTKK